MPDWLAFPLLALTIGWGFWERWQRTRAAAVALRTAKLGATKAALELLRDSLEDQQAHLEAIAAALGADSPARPDLATLDRIEKTAQAAGDVKSKAIVRHLQSRERARAALPGVVAKLGNVQARRLTLEKELSAGLVVGDDDVSFIRKDVQDLSDQVAELVRQVAEPPRIYLSDAPPEDPAELDIWIPLHAPAPPQSPPS